MGKVLNSIATSCLQTWNKGQCHLAGPACAMMGEGRAAPIVGQGEELKMKFPEWSRVSMAHPQLSLQEPPDLGFPSRTLWSKVP